LGTPKRGPQRCGWTYISSKWYKGMYYDMAKRRGLKTADRLVSYLIYLSGKRLSISSLLARVYNLSRLYMFVGVCGQ